jgi:tRNA/tmRNA/rRNA uracil-C5-methylase (TrmA/RlmC/RlmD family)
MYTPAVEEVPEVVLALGTSTLYQVTTTDYEKRVRAMREIFEAPNTRLPYARKQAERLKEICIRKGRGDLAAELEFMIHDPKYEERQKARLEEIAKAKAAMEETKKTFARELGKLGYLPFVGRQGE